MDNQAKKVRKLMNTSFLYALLAMAGGVFYREFTKLQGFSGRTSLGVVHTHLFLLGMIFFLLAALFQYQVDLTGQKRFRLFYTLYNLGVAITIITLICRGITQVKAIPLSKPLDASLSGLAGIGHTLTAIGLILFFTILKKAATKPT